MGIRKRIVDMLRFSTPFDEPCGVESLQARGNSGQLLLFQLRQLRHADLAGGEPRQQSKPGWFAECPKHRRGIIELTRMRQLRPRAGRMMMVLAGLLAHRRSITPTNDGICSLGRY